MTLLTRREAILSAAVAAIHLAASISLLAFVFGSGMARFDTGGPSGPAERIARGLLKVLAFPVVLGLDWLPGLRLSGLSGYIPFVLNASIWGLGSVVARRRLRPVKQP